MKRQSWIVSLAVVVAHHHRTAAELETIQTLERDGRASRRQLDAVVGMRLHVVPLPMLGRNVEPGIPERGQ